jgi:hypothetical protein
LALVQDRVEGERIAIFIPRVGLKGDATLGVTGVQEYELCRQN